MKTFTTHIPPFQPPPPPPPLHKSSSSPPPRHHATVDRQTPMRLHNLHRITTTAHLSPIQFHLKDTNHINLNFNSNSNFTFISTMSDSEAKKEIKSGDDSIGVKDNTETTKPPEKLPEPPEKPLPGDCCGSGCVRCVWDVYYEELDEYNKMYKSETIGPKVS